jgi:hypothetical protein
MKKQYQILGFLGGEGYKILGSDGDIKIVCLIILLSPEYNVMQNPPYASNFTYDCSMSYRDISNDTQSAAKAFEKEGLPVSKWKESKKVPFSI